jgi:6-pyruvoyltetrahydropterin/6-carboxytetrahydropterin synthase
MHGHSFVVDVVIEGEIDPDMGWLVDFGEIAGVIEPILLRELDHRTLNDVPGLENPTSERLCEWLWSRFAAQLPLLSAITVHETCTARCTYRGR